MNFFFLLIVIILNQLKEETVNKVVNSCGSDKYKISSDSPNNPEDCKDKDEPACKLVSITKGLNGQESKKYCAIIHGKYNDNEVLKDVGDLIKATVIVEGNGPITKIKYIIYFLCIILLF